ncbi:MAG TPA: DUF4384 domain-containing protein [Blastocatellia bacterium]|nr:DUF4384 domain-containing protein [Blastocatellia bacterium]
MIRANRLQMIALMVGLWLLGASSLVQAQTQPAQDDVRNVFLKGRESYEMPPLESPNPTPAPVKPGSKTRIRSVQLEPDAEIVRRESKTEPRVREESPAPRKPPATSPATPSNPRLPLPQMGQNLALGYTLFKREGDGQWMRVDPTQIFRTGDSVRFMLETSVPGYLYVLQRRNEDGAAILVFPHPQLAKGNNYLEAHRLQDMPSSQSTEQWFDISGPAGVETLFFVFSRRPLPMIPARDMLVAYCQEEPNECTKLKPFIWNWLAARQNRPTVTITNPIYGQKLLPEELTSLKQGARLKVKAPLPAVMTMLANKAADPDEDLIVTKVTLTHK